MSNSTPKAVAMNFARRLARTLHTTLISLGTSAAFAGTLDMYPIILITCIYKV